MGREEKKEMLFWTTEEYKKFSEAVIDKPVSFYAFEMLYWTGMRLGELLALTMEDFDFEKNTVRINKSYQRLQGKDVITSPKTPKSNRTIKLPKFLAEEMQEYFACTFSSLIQTILSVPESHRFGCKKQFTDYTVGREYASSAAPCPEEFLFLFTPLLYALCLGLSTVFCDIFGLFDIFLIFLYKMPLDVF